MLSPDDAVLLVVDIQGKLAQLMHDREALFANVSRMISGARAIGVPIVWVEQNPQGLGPTVPEIAALMTGLAPIPKFAFDCCAEPAVAARLKEIGRKQVILCGIEAHICIYQTAMDLLDTDRDVHVLADAVSSRTAANRDVALQRLVAEGAKLSSVEMALFELLKEARGDAFKQVVRIVK